MNKKFLPIFSISAMLASASVGHAALSAGFNFNNATAHPDGGLRFGFFNTSGTNEVYNAGTETITPATHGDFKSTTSVDLSGLAGDMGNSLNNNWGAAPGTTLNAVGADPAGFALGVAGPDNNNSFVTFATQTTGSNNVVLTYATRTTGGTNEIDHAWSYSLDGTNFIAVSTVTSPVGSTWVSRTIDMTDIPAVHNQSLVYFRLTYSNFASGESTRASLIDNVQIIPEPGAALLGGLGLLALLRRRR